MKIVATNISNPPPGINAMALRLWRPADWSLFLVAQFNT